MQLVTRTQWGARPPKNVSHNITPSQGGVALHYEGPKIGTFTHDKCAAKVRGIQGFHMDSRGWADIAYSYMVCPHGYVFECRGIGVRTAAQGTNEGNQNWYAVCVLMGEGDTLTDDAKNGVLNAIEYLRQHGGAAHVVHGHRDFHSTKCPGDAIYSWLKNGLPGSKPAMAPPRKPPVAKPPAAQPKPAARPCPYPQPKRILRLNKFPYRKMKGDDVKWVQWHIIGLAQDGVFGKDTDAAVRKWQRAHGLVSDGVVGNKTIQKMLSLGR